MNRAELRRLARIGAEARLEVIQREMATIYATFPALRGRSKETDSSLGNDAEPPGAHPKRRRRRMSADARKRIWDAQRKRWAEWKAKQDKAGRAILLRSLLLEVLAR